MSLDPNSPNPCFIHTLSVIGKWEKLGTIWWNQVLVHNIEKIDFDKIHD
jgi:hypothetical protein